MLDISLFNTTLGHLDRSRVVIPNRKIVGEILHNYGEIRQLDLAVGITYAADIDAAVAAWRQQEAERLTRERRPDLWERYLAGHAPDA